MPYLGFTELQLDRKQSEFRTELEPLHFNLSLFSAVKTFSPRFDRTHPSDAPRGSTRQASSRDSSSVLPPSSSTDNRGGNVNLPNNARHEEKIKTQKERKREAKRKKIR
jgi:hypothetical protein